MGKSEEKKSIKKLFKKRDLMFILLGIKLSIMEDSERIKDERDKKIRDIDKKIDSN